MRKRIAHYWNYFTYCIQLSMKTELEYSSYLFCWMFMIPIQIFSGVYVLQVIMDRIGSLNGWSFGQVAFLYGLGVFSHGFQDLLFIQTRYIEGYCIQGEFDRMLVRPMNVFFQFCAGEINLCGIFDLIPGMIIFGYGCVKVNFEWSLYNIIALLFVIIGGTLIQAAIYTITGSIAFWTKKSMVLVGINLEMFDKTTQWPMVIYPKWFVKLFSFVVPMAFVSFYPTCGLLKIPNEFEFPLPIDLVFLTPIVGIIWFAAAVCIFNYGLRTRYESAGS